MAGKGRSYTQEFKDSAIQLALNNDQSVKSLADDLGMSDKTLHAWLRAYKKENNLTLRTRSANISTTKESLEEENRRLRKELADVKKDREILKKAAAYFAKEAL